MNELDAVEAKAKCQSEDANSRLLLVDSDDTYSFAANIVGKGLFKDRFIQYLIQIKIRTLMFN